MLGTGGPGPGGIKGGVGGRGRKDWIGIAGEIGCGVACK